MTERLRLSVLMGAAVLATAALSPAAAQAPAAPLPAPYKSDAPGNSWDSIAKLPDWGGVWMPGGGGGRARPEEAVLTPPYAAKLEAFKAAQAKGENTQTAAANCVQVSPPGSMRLPYPIEFLFTPGKVTVAIETDHMMRRFFLDGRPLPEDPDLTFQGYSVAHWEGDTLVATTIGLVKEATIAQGIGHSDKLKIEERIRLAGPENLQIQTIITDPEVLAKPWTQTTNYVRHREWDLKEYECHENNHDGADEFGRPFMKLDEPPAKPAAKARPAPKAKASSTSKSKGK